MKAPSPLAPRTALVLTAGLGTRLRPLTAVRAKPALPVAGTPMICRILRWLATSGIDDTVLNLHHLPATIAAVTGDGTSCGVRVRYSWEYPHVLGSAGGPRQALDILGVPRFFIVNGDTLTDLALAPLAEAHAATGALVTMAVIPNTQPHLYSGLRVDASGAVLGVEPRGSAQPSFHFIGVQVAEAEAFAGVPRGAAANSVGEVYDRLIAQRPGSVRVHHCAAAFDDIGTVADYWRTSHAFATAEGRHDALAHVQLGPGARIAQSIAWDDVEVGAGASITRCIVTDGVRVESGASYSDAILMRGPDGSTLATPMTV